jgi:NAD-dependent DNA ligase
MWKKSVFIDMWNERDMENFKTMTPEERNESMADWMEELIIEAKKLYYTTDTPMMDDETYDCCEESLRALRPDSPVLSKVGYNMEGE